MASLEELRQERERKLELLRDKGINPYPADSKRTHSVADVISSFEELEEGGVEVVLDGRVMGVRVHGALTFLDITDGTGRFQILCKEDDIGEEAYKLLGEALDAGDFIEATGSVFVTKTGQQTLAARSWRMLAKSLLPLPAEFYGLKDEEERYRKRYLDLLLNEERRELFYKKALFWKTVREFLEKRNFLAVETPTLEVTTGGAEAAPFKTHHNDYDMEMYLRISVGELWQKRLMAAGFPRTYEIGRVFRNEGSSPEHLQEFSNVEFYAAYLNFNEGKEMVKDLYRAIAETVFETTTFEYRGHTFDLASEWKELDYVSTVEEMTGINVLEASEGELKAKLDELGVSYEGESKERLTDSLWKYCRKQISGPAFLINHPKLVAPLSKENPDNPLLTKTFQVILAGSEVGRAHAELNDPADQRERFEVQRELLQAGDKEAMMPDFEYVEMLEHGMPPVFGFGVGERLFAIMAGETIRETQLFPLMRPKDNQGK